MSIVKPMLVVFILISAICSGLSQKQQLLEDLLIINETMMKLNSFEIKGTYTLFRDLESPEIVDQMSTEIKRKGNSFSHQIGTIKTVVAPPFSLTIDMEDSLVIVSNTQLSLEQYYLGFDPSTFLAACSNVRMEQLNNQVKYILDFAWSEYEQAVILFNRENHLPVKLILQYRDDSLLNPQLSTPIKPRLEIDYISINTAPEFDDKSISLASFISINNNNKCNLTNNFKDFKLIDQRSTK